MTSIFDVGSSALTSLQRAIATTGHNIANVSTDGYSRQDVLFSTRNPESMGGKEFGTGVEIGDVRRAYDQFLTADVISRQSSNGYFSLYANTAERTDTLLSDPGTSLTGALDNFFTSMESMASNPSSMTDRRIVLSEAETLINRFHYLDGRLSDFATELNTRMKVMEGDINRYAREIAQLNESIARVRNSVNGTPNDLLDKRDLAITKLSKLINVETLSQEDGSINVLIGRGQRLVIGNSAEALSVTTEQQADGPIRVFLSAPSGSQSEVTALMIGGEFGGAIDASRNVLDRTRRELGLLAVGMADTFNEQHKAGFDLTGTAGENFFGVATPVVSARDANSGNSQVLATIADVATLTAASFTLRYTEDGVRITNNSTGEAELLQAGPALVDGVTIEFTPANPALVGDEFLIQPTARAAGEISLAISEGSDIAAAGAAGGVGDNRNVLSLISLGDASTLLNGSSGYRGIYSATVSNIAVETRSAQANAATEDSLLRSAMDRRDGIVGVNLEEEAANLIRYQQAYQAAAQVITAANDAFDTLIRATSR
jgi:flagellar hook-associated protein 1 FlgK